MACSHPKKSTKTSFRGPYFLLEKVYSVERILNLNLFPGNDFLFQRMLTKIKLYKDSSSRLILSLRFHCNFLSSISVLCFNKFPRVLQNSHGSDWVQFWQQEKSSKSKKKIALSIHCYIGKDIFVYAIAVFDKKHASTGNQF